MRCYRTEHHRECGRTPTIILIDRFSELRRYICEYHFDMLHESTLTSIKQMFIVCRSRP